MLPARRGCSQTCLKNQERPGPEWNQPDGMALDLEGRLWVAHYGMKAVHVLSPAGKLLGTYDGGNVTTSNVCFGGPQPTCSTSPAASRALSSDWT